MPKQGRLPFQYALDEDDPKVTALGGLPVVAEVLAAFGVLSAIDREVQLGPAPRQFGPAALARAVVLTQAAGGDCIDDVERLREDSALCSLLGGPLPASATLRQGLDAFHDQLAVDQARAETVRAGKKATLVPESAPLRGLANSFRPLLDEVQRRWPKASATLDIDATIEESHKQEALPHYLGGRGYQPQLALWVEQDLLIADEFRDGNVPAHMGAKEFVQRAFAALPRGITTRRCRGDKQLYDPELLKWFCEKEVGVEFTVGAIVREPLREALQAVPEEAWAVVEDRGDTVVEAAEVRYTPRELSDLAGLRYIGVRMSPSQQELLEGERRVVYLAVATNRAGPAKEVLRWYWGKAGTIEQAHDVVKNELGGGVLPSKRLGANAAWFRLSALTYNVLSVVRKLGPEALREARPKRLRFELLNLPAVLVRHAREMVARLSARFRGARALLALREGAWTPRAQQA